MFLSEAATVSLADDENNKDFLGHKDDFLFYFFYTPTHTHTNKQTHAHVNDKEK